jgi:hypothetical protein
VHFVGLYCIMLLQYTVQKHVKNLFTPFLKLINPNNIYNSLNSRGKIGRIILKCRYRKIMLNKATNSLTVPKFYKQQELLCQVECHFNNSFIFWNLLPLTYRLLYFETWFDVWPFPSVVRHFETWFWQTRTWATYR